MRNVTIREENAAAALEVMSRFAVDPQWLIYLPPTMSPSRDHARAGPAGAPGRGVRLLPQRGRARASSARRSTWARARWSSSAATRTPRAGASASPTSGVGIVLHPHRPPLLRRRRARGRRCSTACATRSTRRGLWDELEHRLGLPRLRADALVGQGAGAAARPVRRRRRRGARGAGAAVAARWRRRPRAARDGGRAARRATRERPRAGRAVRRRPTAATAGRWTSLDDLRAGAVPPAGHRGRGARRPRPRLAHGRRWRASVPRPTPALLLADARTASSTLTDPASDAAAASRWWEELTGARRRGDGRQAARLRRPRAARAGAAGGEVPRAASTCASSTARSTPRPSNLERLRSRGLGRQARRWRCASSPWASRRWSASCAASRCAAVHECVFGVLALESEPVDPRL